MSKVIFGVRSKTLYIKEFHSWNDYSDLCVACESNKETMNDFMTRISYEFNACYNWSDNNGICKKSEFVVGQRSRTLLRTAVISCYNFWE